MITWLLRDFLILVVCRDFWLCVTAVKISVLCVISAFNVWMVTEQMYTRKSCSGKEIARCRCIVSKFTAASCGAHAIAWHLVYYCKCLWLSVGPSERIERWIRRLAWGVCGGLVALTAAFCLWFFSLLFVFLFFFVPWVRYLHNKYSSINIVMLTLIAKATIGGTVRLAKTWSRLWMTLEMWNEVISASPWQPCTW